ncbi:16S rRNA (cytosine(1402)-N(4))-methyltransferase RsmH [Endozoicomonas sp. SM1973]|uniref:Ribosomal RNA small subunit methyltransferase H n=1 Tax=Spartinivicinus marinus TaxID=2994442 RepID=A0A853I2E2_9GAMM|nr:16S rRNA (cytosine(1402)-N(4))-methyltransferase RsmH [Spartinivicinus marinus]MCX4028307.1 16S rRNA (cytosine(1402)-N(4))-methyltransferase RsmH [Spartinivicinus marinus]NYZ65642.1 16S rRNA (cytosine(1402)-N(4))-methyltransferase RsmH [Spartinivicinus marinus]
MTAMYQHQTVLLDEAVEALVVDPAGNYIDGTFGRGGHSRQILSRLSSEGHLLGIDKDPDAIAVAEQIASEDKRFQVGHGSFAELAKFANAWHSPSAVSGVLLDLGVSSPQLDNPERGFSFLQEGPLDMRMNPAAGMSAADWIATAEEKAIADVLWTYGEERFSRRMAKAIIAARQQERITTTTQLAKIIAEANPAWEKHKHPATRAFQAIRIHINNELGDLEAVLDAALEVLKPGGRLVVISFHSLEDRIVKRFIKKHVKGDELPPGLPVTADQLNQRLKAVGKAVKPSGREVDGNVRSRSSIMRVAEKLK